MRTSVIAVVLSLVAACGCSAKSKGPASVSTGSDVIGDTGSGSGTGSAAVVVAPGIGETCGAGDACAAGLSCVKYYGIAGASGPQFKSCEKTCSVDSDCPEGRKCNTIADGPGRVCR